jgi:hypothetical protein
MDTIVISRTAMIKQTRKASRVSPAVALQCKKRSEELVPNHCLRFILQIPVDAVSR